MKGKWFLFGCLSSVIILIALIVLGLFGLKSIIPDQGHKKIEAGSWLWLPLHEQIQEYVEYDDTFMPEMNISSCHEIVQLIQQAETDDRIRGILLEPHHTVASTVVRDRIGKALRRFNATGKPVIAYIEDASDSDYYLASYAKKICMPPIKSSSLMLTGVGGTMLFYKTMLDKLGIHFEVFQAGDYKGAGETMSRDSMSPYLRKNLEGIIDGMYEYKLQQLAANRDDLDYETLKNTIYEKRDNFFITPDKALEFKLVDELKYRSDLIDELSIDDDNLIKYTRYDIKPVMPNMNNVAVVYAEGMITGASDQFGKSSISEKKISSILDDIEDDSTVKAVVIRVNSPGGSALESDKIWKRIQKLRDTGMPVVVSMGGVAASGGYYISCPSDFVYAEPATITGSIGVIAMIPVAEGTADMIGLKKDGIHRGKFAVPYHPLMGMSPAFKESMGDHIGIVYDEFKMRVAEGRSVEFEDVEAFAQGQVFTSEVALKNRMIDEIGTLDDAIKKASSLANLTGYGTVFYPEKRSLIQELLEEKFNIPLSKMAVLNWLLPAEAMDQTGMIMHVIQDDQVQMLMPCEIQN